MGSGSTAIAARDSGRSFVGYDISLELLRSGRKTSQRVTKGPCKQESIAESS